MVLQPLVISLSSDEDDGIIDARDFITKDINHECPFRGTSAWLH
jgi:hypothetical protein